MSEMWCPGCMDGIHWPWLLFALMLPLCVAYCVLTVGWWRIRTWFEVEVYKLRQRWSSRWH
jgi:hypothetical protein